jgi:hypothetical protein
MDLGAFVHVPQLTIECDPGAGLAVSPALNVMVISIFEDNCLQVFSLPSGSCPRFRKIKTLKDVFGRMVTAECLLEAVTAFPGIHLRLVARPGYRFWFNAQRGSGRLAFTDPIGGMGGGVPPLLLVADTAANVVYVVDVTSDKHVGYVGKYGEVHAPRGVTSRGNLVAVSCWDVEGSPHHIVRLFTGGGCAWSVIRTVGWMTGGELRMPSGLKFSRDGRHLAVCNTGKGCLSIFNVATGSCRHFNKRGPVYPRHPHPSLDGLDAQADVEEHSGRWLMTDSDSGSVQCWDVGVGMGTDGYEAGCVGVGVPQRPCSLGGFGVQEGQLRWPTAVAVVPGLGIVVRDLRRVQVFALPDDIAMSRMSLPRLAWMSVCYRARIRGKRHEMDG